MKRKSIDEIVAEAMNRKKSQSFSPSILAEHGYKKEDLTKQQRPNFKSIKGGKER